MSEAESQFPRTLWYPTGFQTNQLIFSVPDSKAGAPDVELDLFAF